MPRIESVKVAGYFPTPEALIPSIASTLAPATPERSNWVVFDPCAGDGAALAGLCDAWEAAHDNLATDPAGIEMEAERSARASARLPRGHSIRHGDALNAVRLRDHASVLWLNPPYDHDPEAKRLEHLFLESFTSWLKPGIGWLMYLVPFHVLKVSAAHLANQYRKVRAWRLPEPHFAAFKQVLVIGERHQAPVYDANIEKRLLLVGENAETLPVLPERCPDQSGVAEHWLWSVSFEIHKINVAKAAAEFDLFSGAASGTDRGIDSLMGSVHETAMPPKPTHIALALSSGMFNGHRIEAEDPDRYAPLLAKGRFLRCKEVIKEKKNAAGVTTSVVEIERPQLKVSILRLDTFEFHELASGTTPTGSDDPACWNVADLLVHYGASLADLMSRQFPPIHDPNRIETQLELPRLARKPFKAQAQAIMAALKLLAMGRNPIFDAEVGTGKSTMSLYVAAALMEPHRRKTLAELDRCGFDSDKMPSVRKVLILCPPHLLSSWQDQIEAVRPGTAVKVLRTLSDLDEEAEVYLLSRETAKLGSGIIGLSRCAGCGADAGPAKSNCSRRGKCGHVIRHPENVYARAAQGVAAALAQAAPENAHVKAHLPGFALRRMALKRRDGGPLVPSPAIQALSMFAAADPKDIYEDLHVVQDLAVALDRRDVAEAFIAKNAADGWQGRNAREHLRSEPPPDDQRRVELLASVLERLHAHAEYSERVCGEPLYSATASPRR